MGGVKVKQNFPGSAVVHDIHILVKVDGKNLILLPDLPLLKYLKK